MDSSSKDADEKKTLWQRLKDDVRVFKGTPRVLRLVWNAHPRFAGCILILTVAAGLFPLMEMWILRVIIDDIVSTFRHTDIASIDSAQHSLLLMLLAMAIVRLVHNAVAPTNTAIKEQLGDHLTREINLLIFRKTNALSDLTLFENPKFYDKLQRAQNESSYRPMMILTATLTSIQSIISVCSMIVVVVVFQPLLALAVVVLSLPHLFCQVKHERQSWAIQNWEVPEVRRMHYWSRCMIDKGDAKEIRMFGLGDFILGRYLEKFHEFQSRHAKLRKQHWRNNVVLATVSAFGNVGAYGYIILTALKGSISIGALSMYISAVSQISNDLATLMWSLGSLFEGNLFISNLFEFLELPPTMVLPEPNETRTTPAKLQEGISFISVSFQYPESDRKVLDDLSFVIPAGKTVALVGENGAGKTTIVKLLSRLYDPSAGDILVDGINLKQLDLKNWRASIGVVFQDYCRFHMSGRENIGIGKVDHIDDMERIEKAADRGGAAPVIAKLAAGYDTMLGRWFESEKDNEQSADLSGGEWQKIALSRAFMRSDGNGSGNGKESENKNGDENGKSVEAFHTISGAQVLILDEPTAALDAQAEYDIFLRFHELTAGKTTLLISHRFSTVRMADIVLVLENGKIIERGSHKELMQVNKEYARLYNLQADRYKDAV